MVPLGLDGEGEADPVSGSAARRTGHPAPGEDAGAGAIYGAGTSIFAKRGMTGSSGNEAEHWIRFALSTQS